VTGPGSGHATGSNGRAFQRAADAAAAILGERAERGVPIGPLTTYRVGGPAALFVAASGVDDLLLVGRAGRVSGLPVLVLGRGSNLLVADRGFPGLVVTLAAGPFGRIDTTAGAEVRAGGAVQLPVLARQTAAAGLTGLEWGVGIPGSVGGAVRMNAGGHGSDTSRCLVACGWVDLRSGASQEVAAAALDFGYRHSAVTDHHVVTWAKFQLSRGDPEAPEAAIRDIVQWRREHQPGGQNAGSVFTNPAGEPPADSAGWVIEAAGLKGWRRGTAMVSEKHANFVQADPGGRAADVRALIDEVRDMVADRLGVLLTPELRMVGFEEPCTLSGG
jgi:UDP-N-acetylmuramate dehydrogenase